MNIQSLDLNIQLRVERDRKSYVGPGLMIQSQVTSLMSINYDFVCQQFEMLCHIYFEIQCTM